MISVKLSIDHVTMMFQWILPLKVSNRVWLVGVGLRVSAALKTPGLRHLVSVELLAPSGEWSGSTSGLKWRWKPRSADGLAALPVSEKRQFIGKTMYKTVHSHKSELFNNRDFGIPSRQRHKDWGCFIAVSFFFPKELDFLPIPRPDFVPRNTQSFFNS